ncbi:uncharacterized protein [Rutidosis leptorrhynchoides]|uniref:uncharacterized protein n=1 Tax=Rutidosis leptorrhynchoides TaxID=125765 RepID=UPI003A9939E0
MILSVNVRGFGVEGKFGWVKGLCCVERPDIAREVVGNSGGMLVIWDSSRFTVNNAIGNSYFIAILGVWIGSGAESLIVNIYGPHNDKDKKEMWCCLDKLLSDVDYPCVLCGDFNEVRIHSDCMNCRFNQGRAQRFNEVIDRNRLIDIPINGKNRRESNHCPLVFRDKKIDFGPKPFKVFDEWLNRDGVDRIIVDAWNKNVRSARKDCVFRDKLKNVKGELRSWSKGEFGNIDVEIKNLRAEVDI